MAGNGTFAVVQKKRSGNSWQCNKCNAADPTILTSGTIPAACVASKTSAGPRSPNNPVLLNTTDAWKAGHGAGGARPSPKAKPKAKAGAGGAQPQPKQQQQQPNALKAENERLKAEVKKLKTKGATVVEDEPDEPVVPSLAEAVKVAEKELSYFEGVFGDRIRYSSPVHVKERADRTAAVAAAKAAVQAAKDAASQGQGPEQGLRPGQWQGEAPQEEARR